MWSGTSCARAIAATSRTYAGVSGWPIEWAWAFSSVMRPVIGSCGSDGSRKAASMAAGSIVPSGRSGRGRTLTPTMTAWPAASSMTRWCSGAGDDLLASAEVRELGDEVAHRAARDEQAGLLAEELGGAFLEGDDGRVVAEHVVADLGLGHRAAHRGRRAG